MEKKNTNSNNNNNNNIKNNNLEYVSLPAVVLTESLDKDFFLPISCELPESLLPINGIPILSYMIEMLSKNGVTEIYLLTYMHTEVIKEYVNTILKNNKKLKSSSIHIIQLGIHCNSIGDALRDLDCQVDIRDDFILIQGNLLCVADIKDIILTHKKTKTNFSNLSMTLVFVESPPLSTLRTNSNERVVIYDEKTNELIQWEEFDSSLNVKISMSTLFRNSTNVNKSIIRYDLLDIGMAICSPQLLKTFCETFDYNDIFKDYISNALSSDIKQDTIVISILSQYAVKICDFRTYHVALQHVCEGWAFPLVPDYCSISGQKIQRYQGFSIFLGEKVIISPDSELGSIVSIGKGSTIGSKTKIEDSFIGENCIIGNNCIIKGCSILDNVIIRDYTQIESSFISDSVLINNHVKILPCSVIGSKIEIKENSVIEPFSKISRFIPKYIKNKNSELNRSISDNEGEYNSNNTIYTGRKYEIATEKDIDQYNISGNILNGVIWSEGSFNTNCEYTKNEDVLSSIVLYDSSINKISSQDQKSINDDSDDDTFDHIDLNIDLDLNERNFQNFDNNKNQNIDQEFDDEDLKEFRQESILLIKSGLENPNHISNKILELKGLRFAFFKNDLDILDICISLILDFLNKNSKEFILDNSMKIDSDRFSTFCKKSGIHELIHAFNRIEDENFNFLICNKLLYFSGKKDCVLPFGSLLVTFEKLDYINQSFIPLWYNSIIEKLSSTCKNSPNNTEGEIINETLLSILNSDFITKYIEWIKDEDSDDDEE